MNNENKIRDAADAVKGLVQAVPIYEDVAQPAARELGVALQTVAKTIHIALAPVSALVWGYDQIREFVATTVAMKLISTPAERIQTPEPHIVGPALEALRYTGHQEALRELYANLLATSLDAETASQAHPSFVDMIKSMSPDEARILRLFAIRDSWPIIEVRVAHKDSNGYQILFRSFSFIGREAACGLPQLTATYLDNLARLGLVESPGAGGIGRQHLVAADLYEPLEQCGDIASLRTEVEAAGGRLEFERGFVRITDLGRLFCRACVIEKGSAASPNGAD